MVLVRTGLPSTLQTTTSPRSVKDKSIRLADTTATVPVAGAHGIISGAAQVTSSVPKRRETVVEHVAVHPLVSETVAVTELMPPAKCVVRSTSPVVGGPLAGTILVL